ncbi:hypothetical protein L5515_006262 [Caenorhabditis briggsae]|uniref:Uncharacterized protein n=1 Tax=Caenorhabditis briggsae TaxID=6238 RepID=A0AAE9JIK9_CAEBR|nr:hypothetical protein L5515_006262 [Caenorhabditis briggsae]
MTKKRFVVGQIKEEVPDNFEDWTEETDFILFSENWTLDDVVNLIGDEVEQPIEGTSDSSTMVSSRVDDEPSTSSSAVPWKLRQIKQEPLDEEEVLEPERQVPSQSTEQPMELMVQTKEAKETSPSETQSPGADTAIEFIGQRFKGTATLVCTTAAGICEARKFLRRMSAKLELTEMLESGDARNWEQLEIEEGLLFLMEKKKQVPKRMIIKEEVDDGLQTPPPKTQRVMFITGNIFTQTDPFECTKKGIETARKFLKWKADLLHDKAALHEKASLHDKLENEEEEGLIGLLQAILEDPTSEDLDLIEEAIRCLRIAKDRFETVANLKAETVDASEMEEGGQMEMREEEDVAQEEEEQDTCSDAETEDPVASPEASSSFNMVNVEEVVIKDADVEKYLQEPASNIWDRVTFPNERDWDHGPVGDSHPSPQPESIPERQNPIPIQDRLDWNPPQTDAPQRGRMTKKRWRYRRNRAAKKAEQRRLEWESRIKNGYKKKRSNAERKSRAEKNREKKKRKQARKEEEMRLEFAAMSNYAEESVLHVTVATLQDYHHPIPPPLNHTVYHRPARYNPYSRPPPHYRQGYRQGYRQAPAPPPPPAPQWNARHRLVVPEIRERIYFP